MRVAILHAEIPQDASRDELDVLAEAKSIAGALHELGHETTIVSLSLDLVRASSDLQRAQPDMVFNLVESINGFGQFIYFGPTLLDYLRMPYTGSPTNAIYLTTNKLLTKERLKTAGIATPKWLSGQQVLSKGIYFEPPYMVKPVWEDASVALDDDSLVYEKSLLKPVVRERATHNECFVEAYIAGREFNLSMLAGMRGPEVLPPAEIVFQNYPAGKPQIVGYRAKWQEDSFEYQNTVRQFAFSEEERPLLRQMEQIALQCWHLFQLRGYARVDFRVDTNMVPWVLEVNCNPGIAPDSGFVAAAKKARLPFKQVVDRILQASLRTE